MLSPQDKHSRQIQIYSWRKFAGSISRGLCISCEKLIVFGPAKVAAPAVHLLPCVQERAQAVQDLARFATQPLTRYQRIACLLHRDTWPVAITPK